MPENVGYGARTSFPDPRTSRLRELSSEDQLRAVTAYLGPYANADAINQVLATAGTNPVVERSVMSFHGQRVPGSSGVDASIDQTIDRGDSAGVGSAQVVTQDPRPAASVGAPVAIDERVTISNDPAAGVLDDDGFAVPNVLPDWMMPALAAAATGAGALYMGNRSEFIPGSPGSAAPGTDPRIGVDPIEGSVVRQQIGQQGSIGHDPSQEVTRAIGRDPGSVAGPAPPSGDLPGYPPAGDPQSGSVARSFTSDVTDPTLVGESRSERVAPERPGRPVAGLIEDERFAKLRSIRDAFQNRGAEGALAGEDIVSINRRLNELNNHIRATQAFIDDPRAIGLGGEMQMVTQMQELLAERQQLMSVLQGGSFSASPLYRQIFRQAIP